MVLNSNKNMIEYIIANSNAIEYLIYFFLFSLFCKAVTCIAQNDKNNKNMNSTIYLLYKDNKVNINIR